MKMKDCRSKLKRQGRLDDAPCNKIFSLLSVLLAKVLKSLVSFKNAKTKKFYTDYF